MRAGNARVARLAAFCGIISFMQNASVAQVFEDIADCLEIAGENVFKIRAYRRAAEAVATFPGPIEDAAEDGRIEQIEGLGAATVAKTREFLATGTVRELEKLRAQYPSGLLELLRVPGLGPKKVAQLYRERGIESLEALQAAIANGDLKGLAGMGPKTVENIEAGLRRLAAMSSNLPLGDALPAAQLLARTLADLPGVSNVEIAGEARRGCDTVSRLELVAESDDADSVVAAFITLPSVREVIQNGQGNDSPMTAGAPETTEAKQLSAATSSGPDWGESAMEIAGSNSSSASKSGASARVRVRPGIEAALHVASPGDFGWALFNATGSSAHLEAAAQFASERGFELRPGGVFRANERVLVASEEELYRLLEVPFIAPELRENAGEWQAARNGTLPSLVRVSDIKGDLHAHSTWSDGVATIRQMAQAAQARGYEYHVVSDHSKALAMTNGLDATRLREQAREISEVQTDFPDLKILRGIECDILRDGTLDLDDDILHELDLVIASVHSAFKLDEASQTERMMRAISHPAVDIIAHPTGRIVGGRPGYDVDVQALIEAARKHDTALEINASERLDLRDTHACMAREAGVLLCVNTDAHSTRMLDNIGLGITTARRAWCEAANVLNTKTAGELMQWLARPKSQA